MQSYADAYGVDLPLSVINRILQVSDLLPPEHKVTAGRPRRLRIPSGSRNLTICRACGQAGHYQKTCPNPSTKVRWENNKDKAMEWALNYYKYI